jgi:hypothetical protein
MYKPSYKNTGSARERYKPLPSRIVWSEPREQACRCPAPAAAADDEGELIRCDLVAVASASVESALRIAGSNDVQEGSDCRIPG